MKKAKVQINIPLQPIESEYLRLQTEHAPEGHVIIGPASVAPFWGCLSCGCQWSEGWHPSEDERRRVMNEPAEEKTPDMLGESWQGFEPWWSNY